VISENNEVNNKDIDFIKSRILGFINNVDVDLECDKEKLITDYINVLLTNVKNNDVEVVYKKHKALYKKTKKRWAYKNGSIENLTELDVIINSFIDSLNVMKKINIDLIDMNEIREKILNKKMSLIKEIEEWVQNDTKFLLEYPLISVLNKDKIHIALKHDIKRLICEILLEKENKRNSEVNVIPNSILDLTLFDVSNRKKFEFIDNKWIFVHHLDEDKIYKSELDFEKMKKETLYITTKKLCNTIDFQVLNALLSFADEKFIISGDITVPFNVLLKAVYKNGTSGQRYKELEESLKKLALITNVIESKNHKSVLRILTDLNITTDSKLEEKIVEARFSKEIVKDFIEKKLINIYDKETYNRLSPKAKLLSVLVYKEYLQNLFNGNTEAINNNILIIPYKRFLNMMLLSNKNHSRNITYIKNILDEIVNNNFILKKYNYNYAIKSFELEFFTIDKNAKNLILTYWPPLLHL